MTTRVTIEAHGESYPVLVVKTSAAGIIQYQEILSDGETKVIDHVGDGHLRIEEVYVQGGYVPGTPLPTQEPVGDVQTIEVAAPHGIFRGDDRGLGQGGSLDLDALKATDTAEAEVIPAASTAIAQAEADAQGSGGTSQLGTGEVEPVTAGNAEASQTFTGQPSDSSENSGLSQASSLLSSGTEGNAGSDLTPGETAYLSSSNGGTEKSSESGSTLETSGSTQPADKPVDEQNQQA